MTYQTPPTPKHDDGVTVEEASSLLFGPGGGVPAGTKKTGFVLGTLAVIYGGRGSSNSNSNNYGTPDDPPPM